MRVVTIGAPGGPDVLRVTERERPVPGPTEVLIRVAAAGVNRADVWQRLGRYPAPPGAPEWPGLEVAGMVEAHGEDVFGWGTGTPVCALLPGGGYAEYAVADQRLVLPVPDGVPVADAAALVESACTVWSSLAAAGAKRGSSVLVHGGMGGIGSCAIQVATARGMRVYATAGSDDRVEHCVDLGAHKAFNYRTQDWAAELSRAGGVDMILDVMGAAYLDRNLTALAPGGTLVVIGLQGGARGDINLGVLVSKRARIVGTVLRSRPLKERARIVAGVRREVWPLIPHAVRPVIAARFPLAQAAAAHAKLEVGGVEGKILLET